MSETMTFLPDPPYTRLVISCKDDQDQALVRIVLEGMNDKHGVLLGTWYVSPAHASGVVHAFLSEDASGEVIDAFTTALGVIVAPAQVSIYRA